MNNRYGRDNGAEASVQSRLSPPFGAIVMVEWPHTPAPIVFVMPAMTTGLNALGLDYYCK